MREKRILLVEDDGDIQKFVKRIMELEGAFLTICSTIQEGEDRLAEDSYDLVILDINLPDRSGWALLEGNSGRNAACPIVVFTASVEPHQELKARQLGA